MQRKSALRPFLRAASINKNGPDLPFLDKINAALQHHQTGHSCIVQHFV